MGFLGYYEHNYKKLLVIPSVILVIATIIIVTNFAQTGEWIKKDVSLSGGLTITIPDAKGLSRFDAEDILKDFDTTVRELSSVGVQGLIVDSSVNVEKADVIITALRTRIQLSSDEYTVESIGSSLGESFFQETIRAVLYAFLFMAIVVFFYFRIPIPSLAVVLAAVSDMIITWAILILLGVKLSASGIAAFLMLIGYSVDTDILLTTRVLKRKGITVFQATLSAMKTGLTMTVASLAAIIVAYFFTSSLIIKQIMLILMIGLTVDVVITWLQNAGILRWYLEKKDVKD
jgi:preprotein translocase subunit SecF